MHIIQVKQKEEIAFLENRVNCYRQLETILKDKIKLLETKVRAYFNSCKEAKEYFNRAAVNKSCGIGFGYNEADGMLGINTPNPVSTEERGIPHILKDVPKPLFKESIPEPLNDNSIVIAEEIRTEDILDGNDPTMTCAPKRKSKFVKSTTTNLGT